MRPELLSPAGSSEALLAAIENGADAVYFGGKAFQARSFAENFEKDQLKEWIEYCRLRNVRSFVTVNTMIYGREQGALLRYLEELYEMAPSALIVQDYGVIRLLRKYFPEQEVHASTQMTVHDSRTAQALFNEGVKRVVLAREMTLDEIRTIRENVTGELETFVHGALCFSYSGQCLMSSFIGGRSGNRGKCAQPCRREYTDANGRKNYRLCLKDNGSIGLLQDLVDAGVCSFKIEGRMKRPEYVAQVTRTYRTALDAVMNGTFHKLNLAELEKDLMRVFHRGFTPSYYMGQSDSQMSPDSPLNRGLLIGEAAMPMGGGTQLRVTEPVKNGDGLRAVTPRGEVMGVNINGIDERGAIRDRIPRGSKLYRTLDKGLMDEVSRTYKDKDQYLRKTRVEVSAVLKQGKNAQMAIAHPSGENVSVTTDFKPELAQKSPMSRERAQEQLLKLGQTPFFADTIDLTMDEGLMLPVSEMNRLRREATDSLMAALKKGREGEKDRVILLPSFNRENPNARIGVWVESGIRFDNDADYVILETEKFTDPVFLKNAKNMESRGVPYFMALHPVMKDKELEKLSLPKDIKLNPKGCFVSNLGQKEKVNELFPDLPVFADHRFNIANASALAFVLDHGFQGFVPSLEVPLAGLKDMHIKHTFVFVHGRIPVMFTEQHIDTAITDETGATFPVRQDSLGRTTLYNSKDLCVIQDLPRFREMGLGWFMIRHSDENEPIADWVAAYRHKLKTGIDPTWPMGGYTHGHWFRGAE